MANNKQPPTQPVHLPLGDLATSTLMPPKILKKPTLSLLEKWLSTTELSLRQPKNTLLTEEETRGLATQFISRFGLKTLKDVIVYLNSPRGKIVYALIGKQLAELVAIDEQVMSNQFERRLLEKRGLAFLLMGLLYKREAKARRVKEETVQINEKYAKMPAQKPLANQERKLQPAFDKILLPQKKSALPYSLAAEELEQLLNETLVKSQSLENDMACLEHDIQRSSVKYMHYIKALTLTYKELNKVTDLTTISLHTIEQKIQKITLKMDEESNNVQKLLLNDQDEKAHALLAICNAYNLQIATLKDMISVINGDKILYTPQGKITNSFAEAHFILPKQKKLVFENGTYYLLQVDQDITRLSSEEKESGERAYLRLRPQLMGVKQLVEHNQRLEHKVHDETKSLLLKRSEIIRHEIALLAHQLTKIQATQTSISTPSRQKCLNNSYHHMLLLIGLNPTKDAVDWLKKSQSHAKNTPKFQKELNNLKEGEKIPPSLIKSLLKSRNPGRLWMDMDVLEKGLTDTKTGPSPFSMNPFKKTPL